MKKISIVIFFISGFCCFCDEGNKGPDLPVGFEDAQLIEHFVSEWTEQWPLDEDVSLKIGVSEREGGLSVAMANGPFWFSDYYQTFLNPKIGNVYEILIQPTDMDPEDMLVGPGEPWANYRVIIAGGKSSDIVKIYRRNSRFFEDDPMPFLVGEASATPNGDCAILDACAEDTDCIEPGPNELRCFSIEACNQKLCALPDEYQWMLENLNPDRK